MKANDACSKLTNATKNTIAIPTIAPTMGMKFKNIAATPHNNGEGIPNNHIAVPMQTPRQALMQVTQAR